MNEVVREFLLETHENLAQLDRDLVALEQNPTERETLARAFRTLHTVKGTAGFLGLQQLQAIAHAAENLLGALRDGELVFNGPIATALLSVVDVIRRMLTALEVSGEEGSSDLGDLIQTLERLLNGKSSRVPTGGRRTEVRDSQPVAAPSAAPRPPSSQHVAAPPPKAQQPASSHRTPPPVLPPAAAESPSIPTPVVAITTSDGAEPRAPAISDSAVRVDVGLLDKLMNLVGELVLARNQITQFSASQENAAFQGTVQRLNLLTAELQANVMKTRMQPIRNIWSKFPRVVRDLAAACGKQVRIVMEGQDTELDRTIIEAIRDPLTHLVRNAVDHGIETPARRAAVGKAPQGCLSLHAFHESGKVILEITDDGAGIDPRRIGDKAVQAKLLTPEQADRLTDSELVNLVFLPGFSTADKITQFSGRGVGMDVVRSNVEKTGGTVSVESRPGRGTTVKMKIPLTLAIIPALIITSGGERFALPQVSLLELVRLEGELAQRGIEPLHGVPVYRLRGKLLPIVYLNQQLGFAAATAPPPNAGEINIVVLQADDRPFGLVVDVIHDTEEIVVKPLQKQLKGLRVFAGATIMGDGKVALILDILGLAQRANVVAATREISLHEKAPVTPERPVDRQIVLLFATRDGTRLAIPLSQVARLEEFPRSAVERVGTQDVVQYRDEILPLFDVSRLLRQKRRRSGNRGQHRNGLRPSLVDGSPLVPGHADGDTVQVVVHTGPEQQVGLVVDQILDIVEETIATRARANRPGVLFSAVIQGRVTEFLDVEGMLRTVDPIFFEPVRTVAAKT